MSADIRTMLLSSRGEFIRYGFGCGCNFAIKTGISLLMNLAGLPFTLSYFISHCILLFSSFFYHHFITFQRGKFESAALFFSEFCRYTLTMIGLKALDYLIVISEDWALEQLLPVSTAAGWQRQLLRVAAIATSTGFIFLLRYFVFRKIFRRKQKTETGEKKG